MSDKKSKLTLKEFAEYVAKAQDDIRCNGRGGTASHDISAEILIYDDERNKYEVVDVGIDLMMGCGCPSDLVITLKKIKDD